MADGLLSNFDHDLHPPPYSPLERAALAIFSQEYGDEVCTDGTLSEMGQFYWREKGPYFMAYARAVIEAIREPSAQMIDAMYDEYQGGGKGSLRDCWFEAIDALLEEGA